MLSCKVWLVVALLGSTMFAAGSARAAAPQTGVTGNACHLQVPNGAEVRHPSGEVYLDGKLIALFPDGHCNEKPPAGDPWVAYVSGAASDSYGSNLQNPAEYDAIGTYWYVPAPPDNGADVEYESLWTGLGGNGVTLQPVLQARPSEFSGWQFFWLSIRFGGCVPGREWCERAAA